MLEKMAYFLTTILILSSFWANAISDYESDLFTDEERLLGFQEHKKAAREFEKKRQQGADEIRQQRLKFEKERQAGLPDYLKQKELEKRLFEEMSEWYYKDQKQKDEMDLQLEKARRKYVADRDAAKKRKQSKVRLTEEEEYDIPDRRERVDPKLRVLYGAKSKFSSGSAQSGGSSGGGFTPPSSGNDFIPPPPPPPPPEFNPPQEFFEPDMMPPPPPTFDDMPPPIFEEPQF